MGRRRKGWGQAEYIAGRLYGEKIEARRRGIQERDERAREAKAKITLPVVKALASKSGSEPR